MKYLTLAFTLLFTINTLAQQQPLHPKVDRAVYFDISPPLRDMIPTMVQKYDGSWKDGVVKNYSDQSGDADRIPGTSGVHDPALQNYFGRTLTDTTILNFDGMGNAGGYVPPDTHGDVGLSQYFQVVNCSYAIFNKSGSRIFGPYATSSVWSGMPNNSNDGDAIVLYDETANRWLFSQFSLPNGSSTPPFYQMIAVSQTSDPTGSWYRYQYEFSAMPDYPKFGIWPDGYYMSTNDFVSGSGWVGNGAYSYDRTAMLAGNPEAQRISFTLPAGSEGFISLLPADCDGTFPPIGTPNYFTYIKTHESQHLGVIEFHSDWTNPANATFGNTSFLDVNPFNTLGGFDNGIPQRDSPQKLETLSDRLMYRQQFRQFVDYSSMVLNHSVDAGSGVSGVRWYELRNTGTGWSVYQQSTYAPDSNSRWMGSIAQDTAGSIALGYSVSSTTMYPAIRYTGRLKTDPLNVMTINERTIIDGGGSQTGNWSGRSRWGDYSAMNVDPSTPTTFWYTTEYYLTTSSSSWQTRIGSFTFDDIFSSAASATPSIKCSSNSDSVQLFAYAYGGSMNYNWNWTSIPAGFTSTLNNPKVLPLENTRYIAAVSDGNQTRYDTISVKIVPAPTISAGNDTIVCWYTSPIPVFGMAENCSAKVWGTSGDGYFSDRFALDTDYFPGLQDKISGQVQLILFVKPVAPCEGNVMSIKHVVLDPCTGIEEISAKEIQMNVKPNPAHEIVTLTVTGIKNERVTISVIDPAGQTLSSFEIEPTDHQFVTSFDVSRYQKGIYLVRLKSGSQIKTDKLVIQ
ncbi:MAG: T9SS type A sorting domain-containing protein [Bacteroidales bacterium]|jgi:hypothetical protein|nr:T9SS type A sorting domain-containing protein [Bacteroidales bacterium]